MILVSCFPEWSFGYTQLVLVTSNDPHSNVGETFPYAIHQFYASNSNITLKLLNFKQNTQNSQKASVTKWSPLRQNLAVFAVNAKFRDSAHTTKDLCLL
jgi:hypothetical protein